jgi:hypothetical protein
MIRLRKRLDLDIAKTNAASGIVLLQREIALSQLARPVGSGGLGVINRDLVVDFTTMFWSLTVILTVNHSLSLTGVS